MSLATMSLSPIAILFEGFYGPTGVYSRRYMMSLTFASRLTARHPWPWPRSVLEKFMEPTGDILTGHMGDPGERFIEPTGDF